MKKVAERTKMFIAASLLGLFLLSACGETDSEILDDISTEIETENANAKKQKA